MFMNINIFPDIHNLHDVIFPVFPGKKRQIASSNFQVTTSQISGRGARLANTNSSICGRKNKSNLTTAKFIVLT